MTEAGSKITIYLNPDRAETIDHIRMEMVKKYGVGITVSAIIGRLIDDGAEGLLERPFAPRLAAAEKRIDEIVALLKAQDKSPKTSIVGPLHQEISKMLMEHQVLLKRLELGRPDGRGGKRLHGDYDACFSVIGRLASVVGESTRLSIAAASKGV